MSRIKALLKRRPESAAGDQDHVALPPSRIKSLSIAEFRGIDQLAVPHLGDVSLVAGRNGVGKTTMLEALRVYAARGRAETLEEVLNGREELATLRDERGGPFYAPAIDRLFHRGGSAIEIGPVDESPTLKIAEIREPGDVPERLREFFRGEDIRYLSVIFDEAQIFLPWSVSSTSPYAAFRSTPWTEDTSLPIRCESVGPTPPDGQKIAALWDSVVLTEDEALPLEALGLVFDNCVQRAAVIGDGAHHPRRVVVKLSDQSSPVPLRSLGEGAVRMFVIALALANCRDGILLIDEAENGIHYSLQRKFWGMVLRTAKAHNTQVVATTHSKDCINGFAAAALACPNIDANLVRIGRHNGKLRAVDYSIEELETAAEQNIEVR